jgi:hypothetical protein
MKIEPRGPRDFGVNGYVLAQFPNVPLAVALLGVIVSRIFDEGSTAYFVSRAFFFVGLAVWAWLELAEGVNMFRRILGAVALAWTIFMLQDDLSGAS